jgi:hypothetical protein
MSRAGRTVGVARGGVGAGAAPDGGARGGGALALRSPADERRRAAEARALSFGRAAELTNRVASLCESVPRGLVAGAVRRAAARPTPERRRGGKAVRPPESAPAAPATSDTQEAVATLRALAERQGLALAAQLLADVGRALRPQSVACRAEGPALTRF